MTSLEILFLPILLLVITCNQINSFHVSHHRHTSQHTLQPRHQSAKTTTLPTFFSKSRLFSSDPAAPKPQIISPFDPKNPNPSSIPEDATTLKEPHHPSSDKHPPLTLTPENVEFVLDILRPALEADNGNVRLKEIIGSKVYLELLGECGNCPSSQQTLKLGLEKTLKNRIPQITDVIEVREQGPSIVKTEVEKVLDTVRPFLKVAKGEILLVEIVGGDSEDAKESVDIEDLIVETIPSKPSTQPIILLKMSGLANSLASVKGEIAKRLRTHFIQPGMRVNWEGEVTKRWDEDDEF